MRKKPENIKEVLRELVERCQVCGSLNILIMNYREYTKQKIGIWEEFDYMFFPPNSQEIARRNKDGVEIEYLCRRCDEEFVEFYDRKTCDAFLMYMKTKYRHCEPEQRPAI